MELSHLNIFNYLAYAHVEATEKSKLDLKSQKMTFIKYLQEVKGYLLWDSQAQRLVISRHVIFDERSILEWSGSIDGVGEVKMDSGDQAQADGMQSTSTYRSVPIEIELDKTHLTQVED